ncbi:hypothetical protein [Streptomyces sp. HPF1205]|uniref:hypothetical protein n=1 Tax=Streptomyces sp. HPF1205 TaxID=2873262 RepID=UPI001CECFC28|nr:hypothetical protein [Streptomyces sp. HPF1205]
MVTADRHGPAGGAAGGPGGPGPTEEHELRVLLERGVPQLAAPAQRLERVRERVRRRRRRRAAGVCGVLVAAVGTAGLLLPRGVAGGGPVEPGAAPPATVGSPPARGPSPTSSAPATTDSHPLPQLVRFADKHLTLRTPLDWEHREAPGTIYVASDPLLAGPKACADPLSGYCLPLRQPMAFGGSLLVLQVRHEPALASKADRRNALVPYPLGKACRVEGGTEQWYALVGRTAPPATDSVVLTGSVCLAHPTEDQRQWIRALLTSADFS